MEIEQESAAPAADILQAAQCALAFLQDFTGPEKEQIPFLILAALAQESARLLDAGVAGDAVKLDSRG